MRDLQDPQSDPRAIISSPGAGSACVLGAPGTSDSHSRSSRRRSENLDQREQVLGQPRADPVQLARLDAAVRFTTSEVDFNSGEFSTGLSQEVGVTVGSPVHIHRVFV